MQPVFLVYVPPEFCCPSQFHYKERQLQLIYSQYKTTLGFLTVERGAINIHYSLYLLMGRLRHWFYSVLGCVPVGIIAGIVQSLCP